MEGQVGNGIINEGIQKKEGLLPEYFISRYIKNDQAFSKLNHFRTVAPRMTV